MPAHLLYKTYLSTIVSAALPFLFSPAPPAPTTSFTSWETTGVSCCTCLASLSLLSLIPHLHCRVGQGQVGQTGQDWTDVVLTDRTGGWTGWTAPAPLPLLPLHAPPWLPTLCLSRIAACCHALPHLLPLSTTAYAPHLHYLPPTTSCLSQLRFLHARTFLHIRAHIAAFLLTACSLCAWRR